MKSRAWVFCLLFVGPAAFAAEVPAPSKISKVTVYPDRALVTRAARVELEAGDHEIVFTELPGSVQEESLRAEGRASGGVTIRGAELQKQFTVHEPAPDLARIDKEIQVLVREQRALEQKQAALQAQRQFLDAVRDFSSVQIPKEIVTRATPPAEWTGISQYLLDSYTANGVAGLDLQNALEEKNLQIQAKYRERGELSGAATGLKRAAVVHVSAKAKTTLELELGYVVPAATWSVAYEVGVDPKAKSASLVTYGEVRQWSGEDWNQVKLVLSTAQPAIGGRMPELPAWYVDFYQEPVAYYAARLSKSKDARAQNAMMEADMMAGSSAPVPEPSAPAELAVAQVSQELGSVSYELPVATTVRADNRFYRTPVQTEKLPVEFDYQSTPKLSLYAYLHSKVTNNLDHPLAPGPAQVLVNGTFIGKTAIPVVGENESFDLFLGVDQEIRVKRTELKDKRKKTMLGLKVRKDYAYKIEVENYKSETVRVTVIDQLPVSKNQDIKAEITASNPPATKERDLGIREWTLELAPKEKKTVEFSFFVEYPSDKPVTGV